jgi:hypothetical protein
VAGHQWLRAAYLPWNREASRDTSRTEVGEVDGSISKILDGLPEPLYLLHLGWVLSHCSSHVRNKGARASRSGSLLRHIGLLEISSVNTLSLMSSLRSALLTRIRTKCHCTHTAVFDLESDIQERLCAWLLSARFVCIYCEFVSISKDRLATSWRYDSFKEAA